MLVDLSAWARAIPPPALGGEPGQIIAPSAAMIANPGRTRGGGSGRPAGAPRVPGRLVAGGRTAMDRPQERRPPTPVGARPARSPAGKVTDNPSLRVLILTIGEWPCGPPGAC